MFYFVWTQLPAGQNEKTTLCVFLLIFLFVYGKGVYPPFCARVSVHGESIIINCDIIIHWAARTEQ
jgi:hypothetical protein